MKEDYHSKLKKFNDINAVHMAENRQLKQLQI